MDSTHDNSTPAAKPEPKLFAMVGQFADVSSVYQAAQQVRDAGWKRWDVHSPFPIHGIDAAMGTKPTILPLLTLGGAIAGFLGGLFMTWWTNATTVAGLPVNFQGYQFLISGKPMFSLPANIPIIFETTVLFAALATVFGMLGLNFLPKLYHPLHTSKTMIRATDDRFFVVLEAEDDKFDPAVAQAWLKELGATDVEAVYDTQPPDW
jgi:hypothetical protein